MREVHLAAKVKMGVGEYTARLAGSGYRASSTMSAAVAVLRAAEKCLDGTDWVIVREPECVATIETGRELWQLVIGVPG